MITQAIETLPVFERATEENRGDQNIIKWSGVVQPPTIGQRIKVTMNDLGHGKVIGYFTAAGYLGVRVILENPPAWYTKQNAIKTDKAAYVFGREITFADEAMPTMPNGELI